MSNWKARLLVGFMAVAMLLATIAGPVLANDGKRGNGFNGRGNDNNHDNRFDNDSFFFTNSFDNDDDEFFFYPFLFGDAEVEFFCDDDDDDFDGFVECDDLFAVVEFD